MQTLVTCINMRAYFEHMADILCATGI